MSISTSELKDFFLEHFPDLETGAQLNTQFDSLDTVKLIFLLKKVYNIELKINEITDDNFSSIEILSTFLGQKLNA